MIDPNQPTSLTRDDVIKMVNSVTDQMRLFSQKIDQTNHLLLEIGKEVALMKQQTHLRLIALEETNKVAMEKEKTINERVKAIETEIVIGQTYASIFKWCATAFIGIVIGGVWAVGKNVWETQAIKEKLEIQQRSVKDETR